MIESKLEELDFTNNIEEVAMYKKNMPLYKAL